MNATSVESSSPVWVIDDDDVRYSIQFALATYGLKVEVFSSIDGFLKAVPLTSVGCLVMDHQLLSGDTRGLLAQLREAQSPIQTVVFAGQASVLEAVQTLEAGACGFLMKPVDPEALHAKVLRALSQSERRAKVIRAQQVLSTLSSREQQIFLCVAQGWRSQEIADRLFLSVRTVEGHRLHIMNKLGDYSPLSLLYDLAQENLDELCLQRAHRPKKAQV